MIMQSDISTSSLVHELTRLVLHCHNSLFIMHAGEPVRLDPANFKEVVRLLWDAKHQWYKLGLELGISKSRLNWIEHDHDTAEACFKKMIERLLKNIINIDPTPTWQIIVNALCQPSVDCREVAEKIAEKYKDISLPPKPIALPSPTTAVLGSLLLSLCTALVAHVWILSHGNSSSGARLVCLDHKLEYHDRLLVGREKDMADVMAYFNNTSVVSLFGTSGFGKTHLAKHIGNKMKASGYCVLYVRVEDYTHIDDVKAKLKKITKVPRDMPLYDLHDWAKSLPDKTLLILDNVDGEYWTGNSSARLSLQINLIDIVVQCSEAKVLTTSQEELNDKYKSHQLLPLSTQDCIRLFDELVRNKGCGTPGLTDFISNAYCKEICKIVGNTPLIINLLGKTFLCSDPKDLSRSVDEVFKTVVKRNLKKDPFVPFKLAFRFISEACQRYSFLMYKFQSSFSVEDSKLLVSSEMLGAGSENNYTIQSACLVELTSKSFLEMNNNSYSFHVLVRVFLNSTLHEHNMTTQLQQFWENYFSWQYYSPPKSWKPVDIYVRDVELFAAILSQRSNHSYPLAFFMTRVIAARTMILWDSPHYLMISHHYDTVVALVAHFLHVDCQHMDWPYSSAIKIADLFSAYNALFTVEVNRHLNLDLLIACEQRAKQLHLGARGDHRVTFNRSVFHNRNIEGQCKLIQNQHAICKRDRWQYRLLDLALQMQAKPCGLFNSSLAVLFLAQGMDKYALMELDKAIPYFELALQYSQHTHFSKLHTTITSIGLYSIYVKLNDSLRATTSLARLKALYSECSNLTCYSPVYGYIVIPFLREGGGAGLVGELCTTWLQSYQACNTLCTDPYTLLYRKKAWKDIMSQSFC